MRFLPCYRPTTNLPMKKNCVVLSQDKINQSTGYYSKIIWNWCYQCLLFIVAISSRLKGQITYFLSFLAFSTTGKSINWEIVTAVLKVLYRVGKGKFQSSLNPGTIISNRAILIGCKAEQDTFWSDKGHIYQFPITFKGVFYHI